MSKSNRFDKIQELIQESNKEVPLKENIQPQETKNITVYSVPSEWIEILKQNHLKLSSFAKQAMFEKMKRDGLI